jgi:nucleoid-associated protein YgaU
MTTARAGQRSPSPVAAVARRLLGPSALAAALLGSPAALLAAPSPVVHVVKPGETLWSIAARAEVYGDPLLWLLIYRWNRDQIANPARIYPRQELVIPTDVDPQTRSEARQEALEQP